MITVLFDGIAYGMLLFVLACGLAVTLGLMNFVNLAHGAFAMAGGYACVILTNKAGVPFLWSLPVAFLVPAVIGAVLERTLYAHMYSRPHLDQVLFSIGLVFMAVTTAEYFMHSTRQFPLLPPYLQGRVEVLGVSMGVYRLFVIAVCGLITLLLQWVLVGTRFGSRLRAAVDDRRVASGLGINVGAIFLSTFAVGSGLAGLGGALAGDVTGLDPTFPLRLMLYFLIVVTVGGTTSITGPLAAAIMLGVADVAGKYYLTNLVVLGYQLPQLGGFVIYVFMIVVLLVRPQGLFTRGR
jgi:branched-chain amino acid transport system permease protein